MVGGELNPAFNTHLAKQANTRKYVSLFRGNIKESAYYCLWERESIVPDSKNNLHKKKKNP